MAVTITRTAWTDDDGSGTTGTVINNAVKTSLYDQIDAALALLLPLAGGTLAGDLKFTDATYDIGKSGATRPRDLFLSRNLVVGGTTTLTGNVVSDLLFTDATYDIGKTGATRPRDGFFSRNLTAGGLLDISGAGAGQISFPATQNPSAGANVLDDYEEGTFTPVLGGSGGTSGQTYAANGQIGHYVKIGKFVHCQGYIALSAKGTITGNCQIQGLPFAAESGTNVNSTGRISNWVLNTNWSYIAGELVPGATAWTLRGTQAAASTFSTLATGDIQNATEFVFEIRYKTGA